MRRCKLDRKQDTWLDILWNDVVQSACLYWPGSHKLVRAAEHLLLHLLIIIMANHQSRIDPNHSRQKSRAWLVLAEDMKEVERVS